MLGGFLTSSRENISTVGNSRLLIKGGRIMQEKGVLPEQGKNKRGNLGTTCYFGGKKEEIATLVLGGWKVISEKGSDLTKRPSARIGKDVDELLVNLLLPHARGGSK